MSNRPSEPHVTDLAKRPFARSFESPEAGGHGEFFVRNLHFIRAAVERAVKHAAEDNTGKRHPQTGPHEKAVSHVHPLVWNAEQNWLPSWHSAQTQMINITPNKTRSAITPAPAGGIRRIRTASGDSTVRTSRSIERSRPIIRPCLASPTRLGDAQRELARIDF